MRENQPISSLLKRLWHHISPRRRGQFGLLLVLMLLASFAEILSIGAVLPFLGVLTAPELVYEMTAAKPIIQVLKLTEPKQLLLPLTIFFGSAALIAGAMRLTLLWASTKLSFATGADLSIGIYRRTLYQPYAVHCARNSSEIINGISSKAKIVIVMINMVLNLISSSFVLITILFTLLLLNPFIALVVFGGFGFIYTIVITITRKKLYFNSKRIARESTQVIKSLQEGLGGIRDILIDGTQEAYCDIYRKADFALRDATGTNSFISTSPRYAMEAFAIMLMAGVAYSLAQQVDGITKAIPMLGALALGAQRMLPVLQQAFTAWTQIKSGQISLNDTLELLDQPLPMNANRSVGGKLPFNYKISLKQLNYRYGHNLPYILKAIDFNIRKGDRVGFIGVTGSGKSTLLDIIMGLLEPTEGSLEIDGQAVKINNNRAWQNHIAHVPQTIFLADSSIEENIAFGIPKDQIDHHRVKQAAQQAKIAETIERFPNQYQTFVGERGVRLSGGQRQRIGIARALYRQADVIILDEATSALDNETEEAVMHSIENIGKNITILIVAHRLTTLKNCNRIVHLEDGAIKKIGSYEEIVLLDKS